MLTAWQSAALWAGLAFVVGLVAPYAGARRGSSGLAAAVAVVAVYAPLVFSAAMVAFAAAMFVMGSPRAALPAALAGGVVGGWIGWQVEAASLWGLTNGPEVSLWSAALGCVLYARWRKGDVLVTVLDQHD